LWNRYFSKSELSELFTLGDPTQSLTQLQLEAMHKAKTKEDSSDFARYLRFASKKGQLLFLFSFFFLFADEKET